MNLDEYRLTIARNMAERTLQGRVEMLAKELGWLFYHTHDSRRSQAGFPDIVLAHPETGRLVVRELKTMKGTTSTEQDQWLAAFTAAGIDTGVWRPIDLLDETILTTLMTRSTP